MATQQSKQPRNQSIWWTDEFKSFFHRRIPDLATLRSNLSHASFIAMDTEHGRNVSSIGLAFAPNLVPIRYPMHPASMTGAPQEKPSTPQQPGVAAPKEYAPQSVCLNIREFQRSRRTRERTWGRPDQTVNMQDIESEMTKAVVEFRGAEPERPLILVTYSSGAEWRAICNLFPDLWHMFSTWVDIQLLVMEAYHTNTSYQRLHGGSISLRNAMRTLGFTTGYQPRELHHAGNDALRTLAVMACLTREDAQLQRLDKLEDTLREGQYRMGQNLLRGTGKRYGLLGRRPGPRSRYPHVAKVWAVSRAAAGFEAGTPAGRAQRAAAEGPEHKSPVCLPPAGSGDQECDEVWDLFSPYQPVAIGRVCREDCYYVCVGSQEALRQLIGDLNGALGAREVLVAEDVSDLRLPGTAKREERAKRRHMQQQVDWEYELDWAGNMDESILASLE